jgi:hypothetical protein
MPKELCVLLAALDDLADLANPSVCRSQSVASWRLQASLDRDVKLGATYSQRLDEERCLVERFRRRAEHLLGANEWHHVSKAAPTDLILPMTVMQHFGVPTRLLDWTKSPFAAAFFAAVDNLDQDGAVWWYREHILDRAAAEQCRRLEMGDLHSPQFDYNPFTFREDSPKFIGPVYLIIPFARAEAQQGLFTIAGRLGLFHDDLLRELLADRDFGKVVIRSRIKRKLLCAFRARGVTATSLQNVGADRLGFRMSQERKDHHGLDDRGDS